MPSLHSTTIYILQKVVAVLFERLPKVKHAYIKQEITQTWNYTRRHSFLFFLTSFIIVNNSCFDMKCLNACHQECGQFSYIFRNRRIAWSKANNSHLFVCFCSPKNTKHPLLLSEVHSFDDETLGGGSRCGPQRNPIMFAVLVKNHWFAMRAN